MTKAKRDTTVTPDLNVLGREFLVPIDRNQGQAQGRDCCGPLWMNQPRMVWKAARRIDDDLETSLPNGCDCGGPDRRCRRLPLSRSGKSLTHLGRCCFWFPTEQYRDPRRRIGTVEGG